MFELSQTVCKCTSVSTNAENMGNSGETKLGMSIYVEFLASNEMLDKFDPKLRPALYERAANDSQEDLTGHLPTPKFKLAKPIAWPYIGAGYGVAIHPEFEINEPFDIEDVKVDKIQFTIQDEGVCSYKMRLYLHPDLEQVGPLCALEKHEIKLTLVPPKVSETAPQQEEESPQRDMLSDEPEKPQSALYTRAAAAVRATNNPTVSALQTEFKISLNEALELLMELEENGVIEKDGDEYVLCEEVDA